MTCIVDERVRTKKQLKEHADALNNERHQILLYVFRDPALINPKAGGSWFSLQQVVEGEELVMTNHPKRSWFAQVGRKGGRLYVK